MAPTQGRVAKPERRWDCHRGTPRKCGPHTVLLTRAANCRYYIDTVIPIALFLDKPHGAVTLGIIADVFNMGMLIVVV